MRRRSYVADLTCEHSKTGYCDPCWRAALARGLTPAEWDQLHRYAVDQMYASYHAKPIKIPAAPKPAPCWNGTAIESLSARIRDTIEEKDRHKIGKWIGSGGHGYAIVATDGARMLAVRAVDPPSLGGAEYLGTELYPTWIPLPAGCDLALRRVMTIYDTSTRHALVRCTWTGAELRLETKDTWVGSAAEGIPVDGAPSTPAEVCLDGRMLSEVLRGPIQLGIGTNCVMLRPADDSWRYVQMGYRQ